MRVKLKKAVEVPSSIQAFTDAVLHTPLSNIAEPLRGFTWTYDKGDFTQWVALFNRFDEFFDEFVQSRSDLALKYESGSTDPPFPEENCLAVLKVTSILLENCSSKHLYSSYEHLSALLAAPSRAVVAASLQTLMSFLKKTHHANIRWQGFKDLNVRLQALAQGWGGKEQGLEMLACVSDNGINQMVLSLVTCLKYEFYQEAAGSSAGHVVIQLSAAEMQQLAAQHGEGHGIMRHLVQQYNVPVQHRYPLFVSLCRARDFCSLPTRRHQAGLRMMALVVMAQSHSAADELLLTPGSESELVLELVGMVSPVTVPAPPSAAAPALAVPDWLRALAVRCLAVMLQDRGRHNAVIGALNGGIGQGGPGLLSALMQSSINAYIASGSSTGTAGVAVGDSGAPKRPSEEYEDMLSGKATPGNSSEFLEALLSFVGALVNTTPGSQVLADAGIMQMLLTMLEDTNPDHLAVVASCVKLIESCVDLSQQAATSYKDLDGLHVVITRLAKEVGVPMSTPVDGSTNTDVPMTSAEAATAATAGTSGGQKGKAAGSTSEQVPYSRKVLIKFLLRAVAISSYPPSSGVAVQAKEADVALLHRCLCTLFERAPVFGGSLFALGASVMADGIHHDPLCYRALDSAGLPEAFIKSVQAGVMPYGEAILAISSTLTALCLNTGGLERVRQANVLQAYVPIFTSKKYSKALSGDTPVILGSGLEELFRFVPQLRPDGTQAMVDILRGLCILGGDVQEIQAGQEALEAWDKKREAAAAAAALSAAAQPAAAATTDADTAAAAAPMETDSTPATTSAGQDAATVPPSSTGSAPAAPQPAGDVAMAGAESESGASTAAGAPSAPTAGTTAGTTSMAVEPASGASASAAPAAPTELPPKPYDFKGFISTSKDLDVETFLPDAISYTTRMLENLLTNNETQKAFVEKGGVDLLLKIHTLPKLSYTFGFSASSHATLAVFRQLAPGHAQALSTKTNEVLSAAVQQALTHAAKLPPLTCVPALPSSDCFGWVKVVSSTAGLVAIAAAVARNTTQMLPLVSAGANPVLAQMGKLERVLLTQAALADAWAAAREQAERRASGLLSAHAKTAASKAAAGAATPVPSTPAAATPGPMPSHAVMDEEGDEAAGPMAEEDVGTGRDMQEDVVDAGVGADAVVVAAGSGRGAGAGTDAAGASSKSTSRSSNSRKKTQEELAVDILHHTNAMIRSLYVAMAKSIHTPARRSRDESLTPSIGMRAASLGLATVLLGNLNHVATGSCPVEALQHAANAGIQTAISVHNTHKDSKDTNKAEGASKDPATAATPEQQAAVAGVVEKVVEACKSLPLLQVSNHLARLAEEVHNVLIDTRRRTCHVLILNFFVALGGMKVLGARMGDAFTALLSLPSASGAAASSSTAPAAGDTVMADSSRGAAGAPAADAAGTPAAATGAPAAGAAAASSSHLKRDPKTVTEKAVQAYLTVYELLSAATLVLGAPQAAQLLSQPLPASAGPAAAAQVKDPAELMRVIQAAVVEAVAPIWSSDKLTSCPTAIMSQVVSVLNTCAEGVQAAAAVLLRARGGASRLPGGAAAWAPDPAVVQFLVDMGFSQARAEQALRRVGVNSAEAATEWLLAHPEEPAPAAPAAAAPAPGAAAPATAAGTATVAEPARTEEEQLSEALTASLAAIDLSAEQLQPPSLPQAAATASAEGPAPMDASAAGAAPSAPAGGQAAAQPARPAATTSLLGVDTMVQGAISSMLQSPNDTTTFSMGDLLFTLAVKEKEEGRPAGAVVGALLAHLKKSDQSVAERVASTTGSSSLLAVTRLLLVVLMKDQPSREAAASQDLVPLLLELLEAWMSQYQAAASRLQLAELATNQTAATAAQSTLQVPVWVEAALLLIDCMASTVPRVAKTAAAAAAPTAGATTAAPAAAAAAAAATAGTTVPAAPATASADVVMDTQEAPATTSQGAASTSTAAAGNAESGKKATEAVDPLHAALQEAHETWRPCGILSETEQSRTLKLCISLLQALHTYADYWAPTAAQLQDVGQAKGQPSPSSTTQATLNLMSRLTKKYSHAQAAMSAGAHRLLLSLPRGCWLPTFATIEPHVLAVLKHMMEDPVTLGAWMESEIRNFFAQRAKPRVYEAYARPDTRTSASLGAFITGMSRVLSREPAVFVETVSRVVIMEAGASGEGKVVRLRKPGDAAAADKEKDKPDEPASAAATTATAAAATALAPATATAGSTAAGRSSSTAAAGANKAAAGEKAEKPEKAPPSAATPKAPAKKLVPGSLVEITDMLIELVLQDTDSQQAGVTAPKTSMEVDAAQPAADAAGARDQGTSKAGASTDASDPRDILKAALQSPQAVLEHLCSYPAVYAWQAMAMRLLTDAVLLFGSTVGLLLKRDAEQWAKLHPSEKPAVEHTPQKAEHGAGAGHGTPHAKQLGTTSKAAAAATGNAASANASSKDVVPGKDQKDKPQTHKAGMLVKKLIHTHLVAEDLPLVTQNRAERTAHLLQAICVRSLEGRRRIVNEMVLTLLGKDAAAMPLHGLEACSFSPEELAIALAPASGASPLTGASFARMPGRPAPAKARALVNLVRWLLAGPTDPSMTRADPRSTPQSLQSEMARTMHDLGMVKALTSAMRQVMLEHPRAARTLAVILHSLETLSRPEALKKQKQAIAEQQAGAGATVAPNGEGPAQPGSAAAGPSSAPPAGTAARGAPLATPGPSGVAATPAPPGTQVPATPADAATGMRAAAGPLAMEAVGRQPDMDDIMGDSDDMGDSDMEGEDDDSDDEGASDEGGEDDEDDEGEDLDLAEGMAIELPGGAVLQVMEGDEHGHDMDDSDEDEGLDSDSESDHTGESEDDDGHPDARGDIATDDDEVLQTEDEDEDVDVDVDQHGAHMDEVHDPHDVLLDMDHVDEQHDAGLAGPVDDGEEEGDEDDEDDEDDNDEGDEDMDGYVPSVPGFGVMDDDDDDLANGAAGYDDERDGFTEEMDEELDMMELGGPAGGMPTLRRMAQTLTLGGGRLRTGTSGGMAAASQGAADNDVGTGFGAMADIPAESLQAVLPTLSQLLGDAAIGGVLGAARAATVAGAPPSQRSFRIMARDQHGRQIALEQGHMYQVPGSQGSRVMASLANSAPPPVLPRLLARPPGTAAAGAGGVQMPNPAGALLRAEFAEDGGAEILLLNGGNAGGLFTVPGGAIPPGAVAALEQQLVAGLAGRMGGQNAAIEFLDRLSTLQAASGHAVGAGAAGRGAAAPGTAAAAMNDEGIDARSFEQTLQRLLQGPGAEAAPAAAAGRGSSEAAAGLATSDDAIIDQVMQQLGTLNAPAAAPNAGAGAAAAGAAPSTAAGEIAAAATAAQAQPSQGGAASQPSGAAPQEPAPSVPPSLSSVLQVAMADLPAGLMQAGPGMPPGAEPVPGTPMMAGLLQEALTAALGAASAQPPQTPIPASTPAATLPAPGPPATPAAALQGASGTAASTPLAAPAAPARAPHDVDQQGAGVSEAMDMDMEGPAAQAGTDQDGDQHMSVAEQATSDPMSMDVAGPGPQPNPPAAVGSTLNNALRRAAQSAGIDLAFLEALPEELRAEVLTMHGAQIDMEEEVQGGQPPAGQAAAATAAQPAAAPGQAGAAASGAAPAAPPPAEEGLGLDPEFLAALPPDIRAEIIQQQRVEQRRRAREAEAAARLEAAAAQAAATAAAAPAAGGAAGAATAGADGAPAPGAAAAGGEAGPSGQATGAAPAAAPPVGDDLDLATLLASFPPDVREDVLLTTDAALLATLPANIQEEARVLRARYRANTFQADEVPAAMAAGMMPPPAPLAAPTGWQGAGRRNMGGLGAEARQLAGRLPNREMDPALAQRRSQQEEDDRLVAQLPPLVDQQDLAAMVGLLYVSTLPRPPLQRTLLNLCAHAVCRKTLLRILIGAVRSLTEGMDHSSSNAAGQASNAMDVDSQTVPAAPAGSSVSLPGLNVKVDSTTAPPMLRRVLESATYLVRHSSMVARMLLLLHIPELDGTLSHAPSVGLPGLLPDAGPDANPVASGKASTSAMQQQQDTNMMGAPSALSIMLHTLQHPICQRSTSTLEFALQLVEAQLKGTHSYLLELSFRIWDKKSQMKDLEAKEAEQRLTHLQGQAVPTSTTEKIEPQAIANDSARTAGTSGAPSSPPPSHAATSSTPARTGTPAPAPGQAGTVAFGSPFSAGTAPTPMPPLATPIATAAPATPAATGVTGTTAQPAAAVAPSATVPPAADDKHAAAKLQLEKLLAARDAAREVLRELQPDLVRHPLGLLAQSGLTQTAYTRTSSVLRSLADVAPVHLHVLLAELQSRVSELSRSLEQVLCSVAESGDQAASGSASSSSAAPAGGLQADSAQLSSIALQGACVLRLLHLLQAFRKQATKPAPANGNANTNTGIAASPSISLQPPGGTPAASAADRTASTAAQATTSAQAAAEGAAAGQREEAKPEEAEDDEFSLTHPMYGAALDTSVSRVATLLEPLWQALSGVITSHIESVLHKAASAAAAAAPAEAGASAGSAAARVLPPGAQQVLPLVESFFVVCSLQGLVPSGDIPPGAPRPATSAASQDLARMPSIDVTTPAGRASVTGNSPAGALAAGGRSGHSPAKPADMAFTRFAERHRSLLNAYLRRSPGLLETSLQPLLHVPKLIEFDNKRAYFRAKVRQWDEQRGGARPYGSVRLTVRREHVFEDSFHQLRSRSPEELRSKLSVTFQGEEGIDAGGVSREWYQVMAREVFNLNLALFVQVPEGGSTFQPNPNSIVQSDRGVNHLDYFRFVGRLVGKALHDGQLIDAYFTRSFYKHLLGQPLTYEDIESVEPDYYKNLRWMLENDITDVLELTFTAESDFFGRKEVVELIPGGKDVKVTEANKRQYVDLIARHRMTTSIKNQINAFTQGFWELVPRHLISIFNDHELELLISGLPDIDLDDLRANTEYQGFVPTAPLIRWFWEVVYDLNKEDRALLIQFVTGTSKVPLEGFKALQGIGGPQKFQIHKAYGASENRLPSAHTCFNQLDLPEYENKEVLKERLLMAVHEGATGFGFG